MVRLKSNFKFEGYSTFAPPFSLYEQVESILMYRIFSFFSCSEIRKNFRRNTAFFLAAIVASMRTVCSSN